MAEITAEMVKKLREASGAGILECRKALETAEGDFDKAFAILREKGLAAAAKRMDRVAKDGKIHAYVHAGGRVGAMVEVNCETDFVARTEDFQNFVHDVAMQVAAMGPLYLSRQDIPAAEIERLKHEFRMQAINEGKKEAVLDRIVEGKLEKYFQQYCLLEQPFIRDDSQTIEQLLKSLIAKTGENIVIRRFARFQLGEHLEG